MKSFTFILLVLVPIFMVTSTGNLEARTRIIGIDGGMDPSRGENNQPQDRTDSDKANTNLLRSIIETLKKYRPDAEDEIIDSYDGLDDLLDNFTCECGDTIFFVFSGHGSKEGIAFSKEEDVDKAVMTYFEIALKLFLAQKDCCCKIFFLLENCYSGAGIESLFVDEHVTGVFTSTTKDTLSTYAREDTLVTGGWLWRLINELEEIFEKAKKENKPVDLDDALGDAHGKARDRTPVDRWKDEEQPQAFRRDTFPIYGHIRELYEDKFGYYMVVEIHDPYWRRGQLDTIWLEDEDDFIKYRKCKWVKTKVIYEDPFGEREHHGPITEADNVKDQLITAHVMQVSRNKVKVHVTWPRHMYCREIWIDNPKEVYEPPDIQMPELPKPRNRKNRDEYNKIKAERKKIQEYLKQHKREWRRNAKHRKVSVCRWIQQEVDILDPNGAAKAKEALKPFGRYVGETLMHVKSVNRRSGNIYIGNRNSWLDRYKYRKIKVPDSIMQHLDTLNKDRRGNPRRLKRCDNIWVWIWIPGSRDSVPTITDAGVVEKQDGRSAVQTRLSRPNAFIVGHTGMVIPEVSLVNNDDNAYDALVHLAVFEHGINYRKQENELISLKRLLGGTRSRDGTGFIDPKTALERTVPPEECTQLLNQLYNNHRANFDKLEAEIYDLLRANYLMHYLNLTGENTFGRYPHLDNYTQQQAALRPGTVASLVNGSFRNQAGNGTSTRIALGYPQTRRFPNMQSFSLAYQQSTTACAQDGLSHDLESIWSDAVKKPEEVLKKVEADRNQLESRTEALLTQRFSAISKFVPEFNADCEKNLASYIGQIAVSNPKIYLDKAPVLTRAGLHRSMHIENNDHTPSHSDQNATHPLPAFQQVIEVDGLQPGEEKSIRFDPQNLSPGKLYTAYYWRADRPDGTEGTENWSYEAQDTLSVQFFIREEDKCQCHDEALRIQAIASGEMTGEVYQLKVKNHSNRVVLCRLGPYLSPGNDSRQSIYMPERMEVSLLPGEETILSMNGYCLDHHLPPPKKGNIEYPNSEWIELTDSNIHAPYQNQLEMSQNTKPIHIESVANRNLTLTIPGYEEPLHWEQKTTSKLSGTLHNEYFTKLALINDQVWALAEKSISDMYYNDELQTPFGNSGSDQQMLLAQQIIWRYNSGLNGVPYSFADFEKRSFHEIDSKIDKSVIKNKEVEKRILLGLNNIWETSEIVGYRAGLWKY